MRHSIIHRSPFLFSVIFAIALSYTPPGTWAANAQDHRQIAPAIGWPILRAVQSELARRAHDPALRLTTSTVTSTTLTLVGSYDTPDSAESVVVSGTLAFIADGFSGVQILDISTSSAPILRGNYPTTGRAISVQVVGTLLFITDETHGLLIVDIRDLQQPKLVSTYPLTGWTFPVQVVGFVAYVPNIPGGLLMLDIHDPAHLRLLGAYTGIEETFSPTGVQIIGRYAYLVGYGESPLWIDALEILDVGNPAKPARLSHLSAEQNSSLGKMQVVGGFAYISGASKAGYSALVIIDVHDPLHPIPVGGYYDLPYREGPTSFEIIGGVALLGTFNQTTFTSRLFFIDVTDPAHTRLRSDYPLYVPKTVVEDIQCVGDDLYLTEGLAGLEILHLNRPYRVFFPLA